MVDDAQVDQLAPEPAPLTPREVRARRRRRRRQIGTAIFVAVAVAILLTAYFTVAGDDSSDDGDDGRSNATATTVAQYSGPYQATTEVNVREGPSTKFSVVGALGTGDRVLVICAADGEVVNGPSGPNPQWLKITGLGPQGFATSVYIDTGDDLRNGVIPVCPPA